MEEKVGQKAINSTKMSVEESFAIKCDCNNCKYKLLRRIKIIF